MLTVGTVSTPDSLLSVGGSKTATAVVTVPAAAVSLSLDAPSNSSALFVGTQSSVYTNTAVNYGTITGSDSTAWHFQTGAVSSLTGLTGNVYNLVGGTVSTATGGSFVSKNMAGGSITTAKGVDIQVDANSTGTISTAKGLNVRVTKTGGSTIGTGYGVYIEGIAGTNTFGLYQHDSNNRNYFAGKVGIGTLGPRAALDIQGALVGKPATSNGTATVDFSAGNLQYTGLACQAFALWNMKDGGSYTFAVQNTTSALCSFSAFSDAGSTALSFHLPPDHASTEAGKHTVYTFLVMGTHVYASWITGY